MTHSAARPFACRCVKQVDIITTKFLNLSNGQCFFLSSKAMQNNMCVSGQFMFETGFPEKCGKYVPSPGLLRTIENMQNFSISFRKCA